MAQSELNSMLSKGGIKTLFFGLGAQRAGSTWMHTLFSSHPDIHVPEQQKELHYWSKWYFPHLETGSRIFERQRPTGVPRKFVKALFRRGGIAKRRKTFLRGQFLEDWRVSLYDRDDTHANYGHVLLLGRSSESVVGEITPEYALLDETGLTEMNAQHSDVRFIYILRDPVDRLSSAISYFGQRNLEWNIDQRFDALGSSFLETNMGRSYLRHSQYEKTIKTIETVIDPSKVHYCFFETIRQKREIERLCAFLAVDPMGMTPPGKVNASKPLTAPLPDKLIVNARRTLQSTYRFCSAKFGDLPDAWRVSMENLEI